MEEEDKLKRMFLPVEFEKATTLCVNALKVLEELAIEENEEDTEWWLQEYNYLYRLITNEPPGLPPISRSWCQGVVYEPLNAFWRKYDWLKFPERYNREALEEDTETEDPLTSDCGL